MQDAWSAAPDFNAAIRQWCAETGRPLFVISYRGPQAPAHAVASVMRQWHRDRDEDDQQLLVPTFVIGDPWLTINTASVPFWSFFSVQPALQMSLGDHLAPRSIPRKSGCCCSSTAPIPQASPDPMTGPHVARASARTPDFLGMGPAPCRHDVGSLGRYGRYGSLCARPGHLSAPLPPDRALRGLHDHGLSIEGLEA